MKNRLKAYKNLQSAIEMEKDCICEIQRGNCLSASVRGSLTQPPFTLINTVVTGLNEQQLHRIRHHQARITSLAGEMREVEDFVHAIKDPIARQVIYYRYIKGLRWQDVGTKIHRSIDSAKGIEKAFMKVLHPQYP